MLNTEIQQILPNDFIIDVSCPPKLIRIDTYINSYSDEAIAKTLNIKSFLKIIEIIYEPERCLHGSQGSEKNFKNWAHLIQTRIIDNFKYIDFNLPIVLSAKSTISHIILVGHLLKTYSYLSFANFNPSKNIWEIWNFNQINHSEIEDYYYFDKQVLTTIQKEKKCKIVLFFSLNPAYECDNTRLEQIKKELQNDNLNPDNQDIVVASLYSMTIKFAKPDDIGKIKKEIRNFLSDVNIEYPNHTGFIIVSCLPLPLNFLIGTLLNFQVHKHVTTMENVNGSYKISWSSINF
jgi:hypothetical protein